MLAILPKHRQAAPSIAKLHLCIWLGSSPLLNIDKLHQFRGTLVSIQPLMDIWNSVAVLRRIYAIEAQTAFKARLFNLSFGKNLAFLRW